MRVVCLKLINDFALNHSTVYVVVLQGLLQRQPSYLALRGDLHGSSAAGLPVTCLTYTGPWFLSSSSPPTPPRSEYSFSDISMWEDMVEELVKICSHVDKHHGQQYTFETQAHEYILCQTQTHTYARKCCRKVGEAWNYM